MANNGEKTLSKGLELIELVSLSRNGLRGKEIAQKLELPVSTVFRQLKFLAERGFLRNDEGVYTLGSALIRLGNLAMRQNPLSRLAHPLLSKLSEATCETVHLAERRGNCVVYIDKVEGSRPVRMGSMIGNTSPLYCTGVGKALLAFLPEAECEKLLAEITFTAFTPQTITSQEKLETELAQIRCRGYAIDDCEHEPGVFCIAAPIFDSLKAVTGAVSVSGSELYLRGDQKNIAKLVTTAAQSISELIR